MADPGVEVVSFARSEETLESAYLRMTSGSAPPRGAA